MHLGGGVQPLHFGMLFDESFCFEEQIPILIKIPDEGPGCSVPGNGIHIVIEVLNLRPSLLLRGSRILNFFHIMLTVAFLL